MQSLAWMVARTDGLYQKLGSTRYILTEKFDHEPYIELPANYQNSDMLKVSELTNLSALLGTHAI